MIRLHTNNNEILVTYGMKTLNRFFPADKSILKDVQLFNGNGYEHDLKNFNTFPELIKYCRNYA